MPRRSPTLLLLLLPALCLLTVCLRAGDAHTLAAREAREAMLLDRARAQLLGPGIWDTSFVPARNTVANDLGKHWWPRVLAELAADPSGASPIVMRHDEQGNPSRTITVRELVTGLVYNTPMAYADLDAVGYLYFSPVGLGWALHAHPDLFTAEERATIYRATFAYDPAFSALNMFTGEGTENHILMGRTGGYLIAHSVLSFGASDPAAGPWVKVASDRLSGLRRYFLDTLHATYHLGIGEWDSSTYYPYVIACWLGLYTWAPEEEIRNAARAMLDFFAASVALRVVDGVFAGPEQRGGSALTPGQSNLDHLAWLWWGGPTPTFRRSDWGQLVYAALSPYSPPAPTAPLARKSAPLLTPPVSHSETKPSYVVHGEGAVAAQTRIRFFLTPAFSLGSAYARPTGGWTGGDAQDILWKGVLRCEQPDGMIVMTPPQGRHPWHQVASWRQQLFSVWWHPEDAARLQQEARERITDGPNAWRQQYAQDVAKRFPEDRSRDNPINARSFALDPLRAEIELHGTPDVQHLGSGLAVFATRKAWAVITPLADTPLITQQNADHLILQQEIPPGTFGGFHVMLYPRARYATLDAIRFAHQGKSLLCGGDSAKGHYSTRTADGLLRFAFGTTGTYVEPEFDWGFGATRRGGYVYPAMPPFRYPAWPRGFGHGRVPELTLNDVNLTHPERTALYAGPFLEVRHGILRLHVYDQDYIVDTTVTPIRFTTD